MADSTTEAGRIRTQAARGIDDPMRAPCEPLLVGGLLALVLLVHHLDAGSIAAALAHITLVAVRPHHRPSRIVSETALLPSRAATLPALRADTLAGEAAAE